MRARAACAVLASGVALLTAACSGTPTAAPVALATSSSVLSATVATPTGAPTLTPGRATATPARAATRTAKRTPGSPAPSTRPARSTSPVPAGAVRAGTATHYGPAKPGGACMTQTVPPTRYTAAISHVDWAGSSLCQAYLQVTGAKGTILVKVDNVCPDALCVSGHLDLSDEAFAAIDQLGKGFVHVTYRVVRDPPVSGDVILQVKDGSNPWWLGLHVDNTGNALARVAVADGSGPFTAMSRSNNGFFVAADNPGKGPFRVRITDVYGHTVTATGVRLQPGVQQHTGLRLH